MALYAIGDLHLSFSADKSMEVFGDGWANYVERLREGFAALGEEDVCVLCGDLSWGMSLEDAAEDFRFIAALPGKKIILKGNHDYWWSTAAKAKRFFAENGIKNIEILHNNCFFYGDLAICGTRGWFYEEDRGDGHDAKIMRREVMRLEASLKAAGEREKLVFLHYPPIYQSYRCPEILELLEKHRVRLCCYGHIHGKGRALAFNGRYGCTAFRLVSADQLDFRPVKLLDSPDSGPDLKN
jgi:predicted phosphohydrolase